ncbi:hypothetical protein C8R47DRAFT_1204106 [Mycena vitilis]|nr:hypothetical protein C8R47DRAFT_1204106 [Mycena vitilis]
MGGIPLWDGRRKARAGTKARCQQGSCLKCVTACASRDPDDYVKTNDALIGFSKGVYGPLTGERLLHERFRPRDYTSSSVGLERLGGPRTRGKMLVDSMIRALLLASSGWTVIIVRREVYGDRGNVSVVPEGARGLCRETNATLVQGTALVTKKDTACGRNVDNDSQGTSRIGSMIVPMQSHSTAALDILGYAFEKESHEPQPNPIPSIRWAWTFSQDFARGLHDGPK